MANRGMDGRTDGRLEIPPCVLQDIGPLGPLPNKKPEMAEGGTKKLLDRWSNKCKVVCCTGFRSSSPLTNLPSQSADIPSQV